MDVLQRKSRCTAFLGIKAYGNPLNRSDIVHGTLLVKISQSDVPAGLINLDRCDGRGYFLYQGKLFLPVAVIGAVNQILKGRAPKASGVPGSHRVSFSFLMS